MTLWVGWTKRQTTDRLAGWLTTILCNNYSFEIQLSHCISSYRLRLLFLLLQMLLLLYHDREQGLIFIILSSSYAICKFIHCFWDMNCINKNIYFYFLCLNFVGKLICLCRGFKYDT